MGCLNITWKTFRKRLKRRYPQTGEADREIEGICSLLGLPDGVARFHLKSVGGQLVTAEHLQKAISTELLFKPENDCGLGILTNAESLTRREVAFAQARANGIDYRRRSNPLSWLFAQSSRGSTPSGNTSLRNSSGSAAAVIPAENLGDYAFTPSSATHARSRSSGFSQSSVRSILIS